MSTTAKNEKHTPGTFELNVISGKENTNAS